VAYPSARLDPPVLGTTTQLDSVNCSYDEDDGDLEFSSVTVW